MQSHFPWYVRASIQQNYIKLCIIYFFSKQQDQSGKPSAPGVSPPVPGASQQGGKDPNGAPQPPSTPQPPPTPTPQPPPTPGGIPIATTPTADIKPQLPGEVKAEGKGSDVKDEPKTPGPGSAPTVGLNINTDKDESKVQVEGMGF